MFNSPNNKVIHRMIYHFRGKLSYLGFKKIHFYLFFLVTFSMCCNLTRLKFCHIEKTHLTKQILSKPSNIFVIHVTMYINRHITVCHLSHAHIIEIRYGTLQYRKHITWNTHLQFLRRNHRQIQE